MDELAYHNGMQLSTTETMIRIGGTVLVIIIVKEHGGTTLALIPTSMVSITVSGGQGAYRYHFWHHYMYRSHVQHSAHCTVCTDHLYNTVYTVQYVQITCTTQYTLYSMYR